MLDNLNPQDWTPQGGKERLVRTVMENGTYLPRGVKIEDIDIAVEAHLKDKTTITHNNKKVHFSEILGLNAFSEYMKGWENTDENNTPILPFISLVRHNVAERGTNLGMTYNVPSTPRYSVYSVPYVKGGKTTYEYYQIPQPVNIDIKYSLHIFTIHLTQLNEFAENIYHLFKESQSYVNVLGHYMPLKLEGTTDNSDVKDHQRQRFYQVTYELILKGYLLNENDFRKLHSVDTIKINQTDSLEKKIKDCGVTVRDLQNECDKCFIFPFIRNGNTTQLYMIPFDFNFEYTNQSRNAQYELKLNNIAVTVPFSARKGDVLEINFLDQIRKPVEFKLCGKRL